MIKISSPNLHSPENLHQEIIESCEMLMAKVKNIQESVIAKIYSRAQRSLDSAARELQYIDRMIDEHYGDSGVPKTTLHERTLPDSNYLLSPEFHKIHRKQKLNDSDPDQGFGFTEGLNDGMG